MNPALSVILFTTLSGAGFGMLAWEGLLLLGALLRRHPVPELYRFHQWAIAAAACLVILGLLSSLAHLGKPQRAWRAFSQWRTSWLSREGVASVLTLVLAVLLVVVLQPPARPWSAGGAGALGALVAATSLASVVCTAMIYASLRTVPAWRHALVVPGYVFFALATGHALRSAGMATWLDGFDTDDALAMLLGFGVLLAALKWVYWYEIDRAAAPATRGDAIGLPGREASVFERPHSEPNFVTREMAFVLARRHGKALRWLATGLLVAGPALSALLPELLPPAGALWLAASCLLAGAFVERWLFFAQARHMVTLYY